MRKLLAGDLTVTHSSLFVTMTSCTPAQLHETQKSSTETIWFRLTMVVTTDIHTIAPTDVSPSDGKVIKLSARASVDGDVELRRVDEDQIMKRKVSGVDDTKKSGTK